MNTGIILLAAGLSKRLGKAKQLLQYNGQSLLQHAVQTALASGAQPVVVVLGARASEIENEVKESGVHIVVNDQWEEGMASSIRCGVNALSEIDPETEGALLMVCDQPFVTASLLANLTTAQQETGKPVVACTYAGTFGPPVFFHRSFFPALLQLKGDTGARNIVRQYANDVEAIPFPEGAIDIDTDVDYDKLIRQQEGL